MLYNKTTNQPTNHSLSGQGKNFIKWTREQEKGLISQSDIERLYESRKGGGRVFAGIKDSVDTSIRQLED